MNYLGSAAFSILFLRLLIPYHSVSYEALINRYPNFPIKQAGWQEIRVRGSHHQFFGYVVVNC